MTSSGTFGYGEEFGGFFDVNRLGAIVTKAVSVEPRPGNPPPRLRETPSGLVNYIGLQNVGLDDFIRLKIPFLRTLKTKAIVNVVGNSVAEYERVVGALTDCGGVAAFELNISCPNVSKGTHFGVSARETAKLLKKVRKATSLPIITKLTPNVTDIVEIGRAAWENGSDILSLVNTYRGLGFDASARDPLSTLVSGGLSGPAIRPMALYQTREAARALNAPIIGMGGIEKAEHAMEFFMVGARAVSVGTANFYNPTAAVEVLEGIESWLSERGLRSLQAVIGKVNRNPGGG